MAEIGNFDLHPGDSAPAFSLPGVDGKTHTIGEFAGSPWLLVTFWCNHCPYVQAWEGRMLELARSYASRGVATVLINSNDDRAYPDDSFDRMTERANARGYPVPYLRDESQEVARAYGARVTPHPILFDRNRRLVFQGRIDDSHDRPSAVRHRFLHDALEAALAGRKIDQPELPVLGCSIKWKG